MGRIVYVEGVPCEVLEEDAEVGIVTPDTGELGRCHLPWSEFTGEILRRPLVIAPDGSLVLPNPFATNLVDPTQPDQRECVGRLRKMARAFA